MRTSFFLNLPWAFLTAIAWAGLAFIVGRIVKRHATIDVFWGAGFLVVFTESLWFSRMRSANAMTPWWGHSSAHAWRLVVWLVVALWSLRLSIYLGWRQRGSSEDSRYVHIMRGARGRNETLYAWKMIYGLQGSLLWFVSIPLQYIAFSTSFNGLVVAGLACVLGGVFFEGVGDFQLARFIKNPANHGTTMNKGLWRYTRHPNYFGDALTWLGFFLCTCATPWGFLTILSPVTMWWLLTSLSGKPMLEAKLTKTRSGYDEYVATTSSFIPRRPKRLS